MSKKSPFNLINILKVLTGLSVVISVLIYLLSDGLNPIQTTGKVFGNIATIAFILTTIPGIITRFKIKSKTIKPIKTELLKSRAWMGIFMFVTAYLHFMFSRILINVRLEEVGIEVDFFSYEVFEIFGAIALGITFFLFLTSNKLSKLKLKKNWKKLHRLTYVALWFIFGHVVIIGFVRGSLSPIAILLLITGVMQVLSLIYAYQESTAKKSNPK